MLFLSVTQAITDALRSLMLSVCEIVYWLVKFFFEIFQLLGTASLIDNDTIQEVYRRVGLILGLFMLFRLAFSMIQYVINPDLLLDKNKGAFNIVKRMIVVVVLLGITPFLFNFAFDFQELIVTEGVIPKLIIGKSSGSSDEFGGDLAWYTFSTFFKKSEYADENFCPELTATGSYGSFMEKEFMQKGTLRTAFNCVNQTKNIDVNGEKTTVYLMEFKGYGLLAALVGCILLWVIIIYTIQVGVRVIQLAYLQLIAPIPIMMYLDPKGDDKLKKWFSQCTTTYFDFFIRTAIMYLVVFVIDLLISGTDDNHFLNSIGNPGGIKGAYIIIIMIIALLIFAKKAPALFKELFPSSGGAAKFDMGIKAPKESKQIFGAMAGAVAGAAIGVIGGPGAGGRVKGLFGGLTKGAISGSKGKKISEITAARAAQNARNRQIREDDSTFGGRVEAKIRNAFGLSEVAAIDEQIRTVDREIEEIDNNAVFEQSKRNSAIIGANKAMIDEAEKDLLKAGLKKNAVDQAASDRLRGLQGKINWARENLSTGLSTENDISYFEDMYKDALTEESSKWIDRHNSDNETIIKNMRILSNTTGSVVNSAAHAKSVSERARSDNLSIISTITDLENQKEELNKRKKQLNEQKRTAQANENAVGGKGGKS